MAANTPPPTPPNPDDPSGTWLTTDNWLNVTPAPKGKKSDSKSTPVSPTGDSPSDSGTRPVNVPADGEDDELVVIDDIPPPTLPNISLPPVAGVDPNSDSALMSRLIDVPAGADPLTDSTTLSRLIDVPSDVWNKLNLAAALPPPTPMPPDDDNPSTLLTTDEGEDELDLGRLPEVAGGGSSSFVGRVPKTEPVDPADVVPAAEPSSGWMPSGTKLPIPGSSADIDLPPNRALLEEPSDIFSTARRNPGGTSDLFGGGSSGPPVPASPASNIFAEPSRVGGGSDIFATDTNRAATGGESDLFAGLPGGRLPGVDERGSSVHDDPAKRTEKVPFGGADPAQPSDRHGMVQLDMPAADRGSNLPSDQVEIIDSNTQFSAKIPQAEADDLPVSDPLPAALPPVHTDPDLELPDSDSDPDLDLDGTDKDQSGSNLFGDATILDMDLASGGPGLSGVNLLDPDEAGGSGGMPNPQSSIFTRAELEMDLADADRVDFAAMPVMGSSDDDRTESMLFPSTEPKSGIFDRSDVDLGQPDDGAGSVTFDLPDGDSGGGMPYQESARIDYNIEYEGDAAERTQGEPDDSGQLDLNNLDGGGEDGERTSRTNLDEESVFSAPAINPADYGIPELDDPPPGPSPSAALPASRAISVASPGPIGKAPTTSRRAAVPPVTTTAKSPTTSTKQPQPTGGAKRGGLLLAGAGLLAGGLIGAAGVYFGSGSNDLGQPIQRQGQASVTNPVPPPDAPADALIAGDPAVALAAFQKAPDGTATTLGRGQARWLARVRAAAGKKLDPNDEELQQARTELKAARDAHANLPADQKILAARAGLHLGLIEEAVGEPDKAVAAYQQAAGMLPQFKRVFDSAVLRVNVMKKGADGRVLPKDQYSLRAAETADDLATAVLVLTFDPVQQIDDEPGFHFWEAINHAAGYLQGPTKLDQAIQALDRARQAHAARRQKFAGRGLNPLSDPSEQMFLRACDELKFYWTFKRDLYKDPVIVELARTGGGTGRAMGTSAILADLVNAKKSGGTAPAGGPALAAARKEAADLKTKLDAQTAATTSAEQKRDQAVAAGKTADAAIDKMVAKLKEAKLLDDKLPRPAAIDALPGALEKAMTVLPADAQMKKLADDLAAAKEAERVAKAEAKKAADDRDAAMKANGDEKVTAAVKAAVEKAKAAADERVAAVSQEAEAAKARAAKEAATAAKLQQDLQRQTDQHAADIAAVRAGASVRIGDAERATAERGQKWYAQGVTAYFAGQYSSAEAALATAVRETEADARAWYFLGLAKLAVGRTGEADADFRTGAKWEAAAKPGRRAVSNALERVQGSARATVEGYRP